MAQSTTKPTGHRPGTCLNCDCSEVTVESPLYCTEGCQQAAALVRYVRRRRLEGRDQEPEVADAIKMRMAHVLAGGTGPRPAR